MYAHSRYDFKLDVFIPYLIRIISLTAAQWYLFLQEQSRKYKVLIANRKFSICYNIKILNSLRDDTLFSSSTVLTAFKGNNSYNRYYFRIKFGNVKSGLLSTPSWNIYEKYWSL